MWPSDTPMIKLLRYDHVVPILKFTTPKSSAFPSVSFTSSERMYMRTPHLHLLLDVLVLHAERYSPGGGVDIHVDERRHIELLGTW